MPSAVTDRTSRRSSRARPAPHAAADTSLVHGARGAGSGLLTGGWAASCHADSVMTAVTGESPRCRRSWTDGGRAGLAAQGPLRAT